MHICQRASALLAYTSILSHAFRASFLPSSHHLKHTDLSSHIPSDPYLRTVLSPALVFSLIFTHTQSKHALDQLTLNGPKITIAQATYPVHVVSTISESNLHFSVLCLIPRPSLNHRNPTFYRYLQPQYQQQKNLETSRPRDDPPRRTSSMQMDSSLRKDLAAVCRWIASCSRTSSMQMDS
jgi:hypothetical protein